MNALFARIPAARVSCGLALLAALVCAHPAYAQSVKPRYRNDRLILFPRQGADSPGLQKLHSRRGRRVLSAFRSLGDLQVVQLAPGEKLEEAAASYISSGLVAFAEPDYKLHATTIPNDPEFQGGTQWSLRNSANPGRDIHAVEAWDTLSSATNIVVAIVDSGMRYTHEDLAANVWVNPKEIPDNGIDDDKNGIIDDVHGINAINLTGDVTDDAGHGTHVSGIIGAVGNNQVGISGVAWNVKLMACKFLDSVGDGDTSDAIRCIDYARKNGASIINASWGGGDFSSALNTALINARNAGIIVVAAAGNDSEDIDVTPLYPASYFLENIVVVGGTGRSDNLDTSYSNYGANTVDLCAPGSGIFSTWNTWDGAYTYLSGTSMAAPHVSGALALMKARFPTFSYTELINRLYSTVDVLPGLADKCKTSGRLNLARALGSNPTANFTASKLTGQPPLSVNFTNTTLGSIKSLSWHFGDDTGSSTNENPSHVFAGDGVFTVRLTVVGTNNRTNSFEQKIEVISNYDIVPEPYSWIDPSSMTALQLADNGVSAAQPLPFTFKFYGQDYSSIYVSANGVFGFSPNGLGTTSNTSLPNSSSPNALICPYWDNLNPGAGGTIYVGSTGAEPHRKFVVSWVDVPRNSTSVKITFQAVLEEGSNDIVFQYLDTRPDSGRGGAKGATIGIENASGSAGTLYTFNGSPHVLTNQMALRVQPHAYRYLVSAANALTLRTVAGQPTAGRGTTLKLSNPGTQELQWSLSPGQTWLKLSLSSGTLQSGQTALVPIEVTDDVSNFAVGDYNALLTLVNSTDGAGDSTIAVRLSVEAPRAFLAVSSPPNSKFTGGLGGPFNPDAITVQLGNTGNIPLQWSAGSSVSWLTASPLNGSLEPGAVQPVTLSLTDASEALGSGVTTGTLTFTNLTDPAQTVTQSVQIEVRSRVEQASATIVNGVFTGRLVVPEGLVYQVEYSEDLEFWYPLDDTFAVTGTTLNFQDSTISGSQRFYRVRAE